MNEYYDATVYPVQAYLTPDGVQYGDEVDTVLGGAEKILFEYSFEPSFGGYILWAYFLIGADFKSLVLSKDTVVWRAQARTVRRDWVDLFPRKNAYNVKGASWKDVKMEGYALASQNDFNRVRFDFRVLFKCNTSNRVRGKIKNNTMFRVVWLATGVPA